MMKIHKMCVGVVLAALGLVALMLPGVVPNVTAQQAGTCDTEFNDPQLDPAFTPYVPLSGPTFSLTDNAGHLRLSIPADSPYDHWSHVDQAPQLRCSAPSGNWEMTTRLRMLEPTSRKNYHVGLMVVFAPVNVFYWGIYQGTEIRMERSGGRPGISAKLANTTSDVELMIAKEGNTYSFSYRFAGAADWTLVGQQTQADAPQFVGLIGKTWSIIQLTADFDYLKVQTQ